MRQLVTWLREAGFGAGTMLPSRGLDHWLGDLLVRLDSYRRPTGVGSYLRTHVGRTPRYDTSKARRELGLTCRPTRDTVLDTMADLVRWGHLAPTPAASPAAGPRGTL
jgi:dihydroflavonol-4-reductase